MFSVVYNFWILVYTYDNGRPYINITATAVATAAAVTRKAVAV
jgi:hypothetical protein